MDKVSPARRKHSEPKTEPNAAATKQRAAAAAPQQTGARSKKSAGSYILSPPKGPRTVSHKRIEQAVKSVLRERRAANG